MSFSICQSFDAQADLSLYHGDCLDLLQQIEATGARAELVVTSPPYNVGKEYEKPIPLNEYLAQQAQTIGACARILSDTGSICWQVGHYIEGSGRDKEAFPLDIVLYPIFKDLGFKLRNRIVWHFGHGLHERYRFSGRHETILWFTRDTRDYTFNLDPVRVPQKYPGKRSFRGPNRGKLSGNPLGKNPTDIWDMPNVKANHCEKTEHPCQYPVALVERLILALTNKGDLVVDPYMGAGTTAVASLMHERHCAGADTEEAYIALSLDRVAALEAGVLRTRPMNKPVYEPTSNSTVARVPQEWRENRPASSAQPQLLEEEEDYSLSNSLSPAP